MGDPPDPVGLRLVCGEALAAPSSAQGTGFCIVEMVITGAQEINTLAAL